MFCFAVLKSILAPLNKTKFLVLFRMSKYEVAQKEGVSDSISVTQPSLRNR